MIVLGRKELPAGFYLGDDRSIEHVGLVELGDIRLGNVRLLRAGRENCRAVLSPDIRALAVELGRIMGDREIDLQDTAVADAAGIEHDPDRFRMPGLVGANHLVMRGLGGAPGITRDGCGDAVYMLKYTLDAPKAATREDGDPFRRRLRVGRLVECWRRDRSRAFGRQREASQCEARAEQQRRKNQQRAEEG